MSMIKSTANTTVQTQSSDNNWNSVSGKEMPGETRSEAKHLIGPVWLQSGLDDGSHLQARKENNDLMRGFGVGHHHSNQF